MRVLVLGEGKDTFEMSGETITATIVEIGPFHFKIHHRKVCLPVVAPSDRMVCKVKCWL